MKKKFNVGDTFICNENAEELKGIKGYIKEIRTGEKKETENEGKYEIVAELEPTYYQKDRVDKLFPELVGGFGFDEVILNEDMIDVKLNKVFVDRKMTVWDREMFYTNLSKEELIEKIRDYEDYNNFIEEQEFQLQTDTFDTLSIEENKFNPIMEICYMENIDLESDDYYDQVDSVEFEPIPLEETIGTYTNLSFSDALVLLKKGYEIRVPEWIGYWKLENGVIMAHCSDKGCVEPANQFANNILRSDWIAKKC